VRNELTWLPACNSFVPLSNAQSWQRREHDGISPTKISYVRPYNLNYKVSILPCSTAIITWTCLVKSESSEHPSSSLTSTSQPFLQHNSRRRNMPADRKQEKLISNKWSQEEIDAFKYALAFVKSLAEPLDERDQFLRAHPVLVYLSGSSSSLCWAIQTCCTDNSVDLYRL